MTDPRYRLGVGYLVGSGVTLTAVLVASAVESGGAVGPLLGAVPALGLAAAPVWLPRVRLDAAAAWRTAVWAALGVGAFALLDVGLLLGRFLWPAASTPELGAVAYSVGFGGVCGALIGCLLGLNRQARTLTERNTVMRRVLRHDLRTEANLVLGHARAAADADDGDRPHLDAIVESTGRLLDRGRRVRRLQRGANDVARPIPDRDGVAVVEEALDAMRGEHGASLELVTAGAPRVRATDLVVQAVADVVRTVATHVPDDVPLVVTVADPSPADRTVAVWIRRRDGGRVLADADLHALDGGGETPLRHGQHTGLWAAKWCLERHGGRFVVAGPDEVALELRRARGRLPRRVAAWARAVVPSPLR